MQLTTFKKVNIEWPRQVLSLVVTGILILALTPRLLIADQQLPEGTTPATEGTTPATSPEQLQQLVAPIALYPDALVAQVLAAATYPTQVVQADRWLQQHSQLQAEKLAAAVDQQLWDPSVKALTAFPSVLANLDKNLSWTEALGEAYFNQQQDVLDAVQIMRHRAAEAGNLQNTTQESVIKEGSTIVIEPLYRDVCYVPIYDPWTVYGAPVAVYPGYFYDGWFGPPFISFGPAIGLGFFGGFSWGWPAWGFNWDRRVIVFNHNAYVSGSRYFFQRGRLFGRGLVAPRSDRAYRRFNHHNGIAPSGRIGNDWSIRRFDAPPAHTDLPPRTLNNSRSSGMVTRAPAFREDPHGVSRGRSFSRGTGNGILRGGGSRRGGGGGPHR